MISVDRQGLALGSEGGLMGGSEEGRVNRLWRIAVWMCG